VQTLTLRRPDSMNSFNQQMAEELLGELARIREAEEVRAVVLTGEGKAFSAGQDLSEAIGADGPSNLGDYVADRYNPMVLAIRETEKPFICAVNGVAAGAGANLALCCDIVIASKKASFVQAFSKIGLVPDTGGTFFLPKLIGLARTTQLMFLNDKLTAEQAVDWGLIYKAVPPEQVIEEATAVATKLAKEPTRSFGYIKRALNESFSNNLKSQLLFEQDLQGMAGSSEDYREGVTAFLEKRDPQFKGK